MISAADMYGVMTPTRSSGPIRRSSASTKGFRMLCDPPTSTWCVSRKTTNTRARGFSIIALDSRTVFGSIRVS
ncbi:MAG: hypothetical protein DMG03_25470 [Acidobacteria bacterium]|nr:MAG: hypothetical protein DMG03_25470 [Acidobacteriota bacterium]